MQTSRRPEFAWERIHKRTGKCEMEKLQRWINLTIIIYTYMGNKYISFLGKRYIFCFQLENSLSKPLTALQVSIISSSVQPPTATIKRRNKEHQSRIPVSFSKQKIRCELKVWNSGYKQSPFSSEFRHSCENLF